MAMKPTSIIFLAFSVLLEIPIAMIYVARFAPYRINHWANIAAVAVTFLFVVEGAHPSYLFFASMEGIGMLYIAWLAWKCKLDN